MCGIYGFIGKPNKKTGVALRQLGLLNEDRGTDSTGLVLSNGKEYLFYKRAVEASKFFNKETTVKILNEIRHSDYVLAIGHTRLATRGAVTNSNAHPFRVGGFVFAHNGCIQNFDYLQSAYQTDYQVDSQMIGHLLNLHEEFQVFESTLGGWFTVPYFNLENQYQLNIAKVSAPLALAVLPDQDGVYFSSDIQHLEQAMKKSDIRTPIGKTDGDKLYRFKWENGRIWRSKDKLYNRVYDVDDIFDRNGFYYTYGGSQAKTTRGVSNVCTIQTKTTEKKPIVTTPKLIKPPTPFTSEPEVYDFITEELERMGPDRLHSMTDQEWKIYLEECEERFGAQWSKKRLRQPRVGVT